MEIKKTKFGTLTTGQDVELFTLKNSKGLEVSIMTYGATIVSFKMPDKNGNIDEINCGFNTIEDYIERSPFFGCAVGRYANRIANGEFTLNGKKYSLALNDGKNHLHGGLVGFDKVIWTAESFSDADTSTVIMNYVSANGEEGYPGTLTVTLSYSLTEDNEFSMDYMAETDADTIVNLTNHAYWNLAGVGSGSVLNHQLQLNCPEYLPVDEGAIPVGPAKAVSGGPFDFTTSKKIGQDIAEVPGGYDHNFCIKRNDDNELGRAASVIAPESGRKMEIWTTKPGIQLYTGNFLEPMTIAEGKQIDKQGALCLETQFFPDSPNQPEYPSCILKPGKTYKHKTVHRYSIEA